MNKLLYITAFPPGHMTGGAVFTLNLLIDLSKKYSIDLIYFNSEYEIEPNLPVTVLKRFTINKFDWMRHIGIYPLFTRRFNQKVLSFINRIANNYNIVYFDYCQIGLYSVYLEHPYKVVRAVDVIYQKMSRENKFLKWWVKSTEKKIFESANKVFVPSEKDAEIVKKVYNINAYYTHEYMKNFQFYDTAVKYDTFTFLGLWSREENLEGLTWFVKKVLPLINPSIKFIIIGAGMREIIQRQYIIPQKQFEYLGFIDNSLDIIYKSSALIAPLFHGAGVKVKVIDAFTTGTPVVGTDITFEGLPNIDGLRIKADTAPEYAAVINGFTALSCKEKQIYAGQFKRLYDNNHLSDYL